MKLKNPLKKLTKRFKRIHLVETVHDIAYSKTLNAYIKIMNNALSVARQLKESGKVKEEDIKAFKKCFYMNNDPYPKELQEKVIQLIVRLREDKFLKEDAEFIEKEYIPLINEAREKDLKKIDEMLG